MLTRKQKLSYQFICDYIAEHGYSPSLEEISQTLGTRSKTSAFNYVRELEAAGLIHLTSGRKRNIELVEKTNTTLPLVGKIAAGLPIEAIEDQEHIDLSQFFMGSNRFILKVEGDSMIEAGIMNGDMVIVKQQQRAQNGDIVVALIDQNEATLKYIQYNKDGSITLNPANCALPAFFKIVVASFNQAASFFSSFSGFKATSPMGFQSRVLPDQRSGVLDLANS